MGVTSEILIQIPEEGKHITGEPIKGAVKFNLNKDTVYKKISLSLVQKGFCLWYEFENNIAYSQVKQRKKVGNRFIFEGHEKKIIKKIYLLNNGDKTTTLRAGSHDYAFEIFLPENIPPSMKTDIGEIKYHLILKFKKPEFFKFNKIFKSKLIIHARIDSSVSDEPFCFTLDKTLTKLFPYSKQDIHIKAELDKKYLIPSGERKITFVATNNTNVTFSIKTELISKTKYKDDFIIKKNNMFDDPKTVREVIESCTVETPSVLGNSVANMFNIIPVAKELCTVRHSKIISREYKFKVTLRLPLPHINSSVDIPVFVGEKPMNGENQEEDKRKPLDLPPSAPVEGPPSYWECMSDQKSKD